MKTLNLWESVFYRYRYRGKIETWYDTIIRIDEKSIRLSKFPHRPIYIKNWKTAKQIDGWIDIHESESDYLYITERNKMLKTIQEFDYSWYDNAALKEIYDFITLSSLNGMGVQKWDY